MRALVMPPVTRDARPDVQQGKAGRAGHAGCAGRTGRASLRGAAAAALLLAVLPASATAQARTVVVQEGESAFEVQVDRLVQELLQKRRATLALASNLRAMQVALRNGSVGEEQRTPVQTSMRLVREHLASLESDMAGIQQRLRVMCAPNERPEGWVGIAYSGSATATREDDGRLIMRFVDYPSIESVEPGSPADKAGIRGGDRILAMSGKDLRDAEIDFTPLLKPGTRIPFKVRRGVESKLLTVTVEPRPDDFATPCPWVDERISAALAPMRLTVTVTAEAPVTEPVDITAAAPVEAPAGEPTGRPSGGDVDPEGMQAVVDLYKESLGLSDTEARCVLDKAMKLEGIGDLSGPAPDMGALMGSGIMSVFTDCGIDLNTLIERMSQAG